ncbi:MAG: serine hydrolase [Anaerolineae bacterium]|nr:serine hydrolase [Anaerolineae bacterium]
MTMNTLAGRRRGRRNWPLVIQLISVLLLLAAVGLFVFYLVQFSQQGEALPQDVRVGGVSVGGLSSREALSALEQAYREPVVVYYRESPILLDPASVGFQLNSQSMLAAAAAAGDVQGSFWSQFFAYLLGREDSQAADVPLSASYQRNLIDQFARDISARYDRPSGAPTYDLATLTLRTGDSGYTLDVEAAVPLIEAALNSPTQRTVNLPIVNSSVNVGNIGTLEVMIKDYLDSQGFIYDGQTTVASVFILDLRTGEEVNINGDVAYSAASTIKVSIMTDYFRQLWVAPPQDEAWLMANSLLCSNNSSSNLMMQIIGERVSGQQDIFAGIADVTDNLQFLGIRNTYITAPFVLGVEGQQLGSIPAPQTTPNPNFNTNPDPYLQTTAEDIGTLFSMIYDCATLGSGLMAAYPGGEFTQTECRQMLELMSANDLLRLLQAGIPAGTRISHKNGWVADMSGDAGIVFPPNGRDYVISVYLWEQAEFQDYTRLWPLIEGVSRAAWNYFSPENPLIAPRTDIPDAAQECAGNYLPPNAESVDLNNINGWRATPVPTTP